MAKSKVDTIQSYRKVSETNEPIVTDSSKKVNIKKSEDEKERALPWNLKITPADKLTFTAFKRWGVIELIKSGREAKFGDIEAIHELMEYLRNGKIQGVPDLKEFYEK